MGKVKAYTDIVQSKKLAGFLPIESADMHWQKIYDENHLLSDYRIELLPFRLYSGLGVPAWSLTALLEIIPYSIHKSDNEFYRLGIDKGYNDYAVWYNNNGLTIKNLDVTSDNFVDACVKMILKLHEQNIL
jgi:hypothetical protein